MLGPVWELPAEPPKEGGMILVNRDGSSCLNQISELRQSVIATLEEKIESITKPNIVLDLEDWEIIVGQSAADFLVFREKGEAICSLGIVDGKLIWTGDEHKAIEFIQKYFELRKEP